MICSNRGSRPLICIRPKMIKLMDPASIQSIQSESSRFQKETTARSFRRTQTKLNRVNHQPDSTENVREESALHAKKKINDHSLQPDYFTGWQSKTLKSPLNQFALIFANSLTDSISKTLTSFGSDIKYRVVYMGFRPGSNMKAFKAYCEKPRQKHLKESFLFQFDAHFMHSILEKQSERFPKIPHAKSELKKNSHSHLVPSGVSCETTKRFKFQYQDEPEKYFPIRSNQYRLFRGCNPTYKNEELKFCSQFECGNLDLAIRIAPKEYDLLMRVDSNTKGHTSWFFFKVYDLKSQGRVRFNIINFTKHSNLYTEGMRPYIFQTSKKEWTQEGIEVEFRNKAVRCMNNNARGRNSCQDGDPVVSKCLSFTFDFTNCNEEVYFAYSIPYSYSYLLYVVQSLKSEHPHFVKVSYKKQSSGGLAVPAVTITNPSGDPGNKKCILATGRIHPGETQGSWMMDGFLRFLVSGQAHYLREKVIFKIIPMVNVDGVVLGNFRTGIKGRDLNRVFHQQKQFPEVKMIKDLARQCSPEIYLDFHGHSSKRNVFIYGPEYKIQSKDFVMCRMLPKIISKKTPAFRYYSCVFKINACKKNTGRSIMFEEFKTRFVYTIEASAYGYGSLRDCVGFSLEKYMSVGWRIADSLQDFVRLLLKLPKRVEMKEQLQKEKMAKEGRLSVAHIRTKASNQDFKLMKSQQRLGINKGLYTQICDLESELVTEILEIESEERKMILEPNEGIQRGNEESDSDAEAEEDDYTENELNQFSTALQTSENVSKRKSSIKSNKSGKSKSKGKSKHEKSLREKFEKYQNKKKLELEVLNSKTQSKAVKQIKVRGSSPSVYDRKLNATYVDQSKSSNHHRSNSQIEKSFRDESGSPRKLQKYRSNQLRKENVSKLQLLKNKSTSQIKFQEPANSEGQKAQSLHSHTPKVLKNSRNNEPMLVIRKSFLPAVPKFSLKINLSGDHAERVLDKEDSPQREKSLISEILSLHQKKKKERKVSEVSHNKKMRILFFDD